MENIAISFIQLGIGAQLFVAALFMGFGVAANIYFLNSDSRIRGVPYLVLLAIVALILFESKFLWLGTHFAIAEGTLWVRLLIQFTILVVAGFALAFIGIARSIDAVGHRKWAIFAFIPILNFAFGLIPSRTHAESAKHVFDKLRGSLGIAILVFLLFGTLGQERILRDAADIEMEEIASNTDSQSAMIQSIIVTRGIDFAIASLVSGSQSVIPTRIDEITILNELTSDGSTMVSIYTIEQDNWAITPDYIDYIKTTNCDTPAFRTLINASATFREVYTFVDGSEIGEIQTTLEDC